MFFKKAWNATAIKRLAGLNGDEPAGGVNVDRVREGLEAIEKQAVDLLGELG